MDLIKILNDLVEHIGMDFDNIYEIKINIKDNDSHLEADVKVNGKEYNTYRLKKS